LIRLTHIDGKLPNLALMKLAHWHRARGDEVYFTKHIERGLFEGRYDLVYGSAIFSYSADRVHAFRQQFPDAIIGGTHDLANTTTVEQHIGADEYEHYDYSIYPNFVASIGFTQRGCRLKCGFCVVPKKEGKPRSINTIADIWRGDPWPRHLHILDNDFFGQEQWRDRLAEIREGKFKVCLNQGINVRLIDDEAAAALASIPYYDDSFTVRRLYTAWDNLKDEKVFMRGVERLVEAGVPARHLMAYMLVGWDKSETWERVMHRFDAMVALGILPYPMIYGDRHRTLPGKYPRRTLSEFQRWAIRYNFIPFDDYVVNTKGPLDASQEEIQL
jgi:hypothetical protein